MHRETAQYLLRFDDLCPAVSAGRWQRCLELIEEFGLQPILAVVPDNRDPNLEVSPPAPEFWQQVRALERKGAAIALHGCRHVENSHSGGLLRLHRRSEFAGLPSERQREWIRNGLGMLRERGLNPRLWVAPWHSFDRTTLAVLREEGIIAVSDGFATAPYRRSGLVWIPQQLWAPVERSAGLWTICLHPNTMETAQVEALRGFLAAHGAQFTSVGCVLAEYTAAPFGAVKWLREKYALCRIRASKAKHRLGNSRRRLDQI